MDHDTVVSLCAAIIEVCSRNNMNKIWNHSHNQQISILYLPTNSFLLSEIDKKYNRETENNKHTERNTTSKYPSQTKRPNSQTSIKKLHR